MPLFACFCLHRRNRRVGECERVCRMLPEGLQWPVAITDVGGRGGRQDGGAWAGGVSTAWPHVLSASFCSSPFVASWIFYCQRRDDVITSTGLIFEVLNLVKGDEPWWNKVRELFYCLDPHFLCVGERETKCAVERRNLNSSDILLRKWSYNSGRCFRMSICSLKKNKKFT